MYKRQVQAVAASDGPTRHDGDNNLWHCADQSLHLKDVKTAGPPLLDRFGSIAFGVLIAAFAANALVSPNCIATICASSCSRIGILS